MARTHALAALAVQAEQAHRAVLGALHVRVAADVERLVEARDEAVVGLGEGQVLGALELMAEQREAGLNTRRVAGAKAAGDHALALARVEQQLPEGDGLRGVDEELEPDFLQCVNRMRVKSE